MLLFSGTFSEEVMDFAENIVSNPVIIKLRREEESLHNVKQYYVNCDTPEAKYTSTAEMSGVPGKAIIFCHTRKTASRLEDKMKGQ